MNSSRYKILSFVCALVGILPRWLLKIGAYPLAHILYHWIKYRRSMVEGNLKKAFPEWNEKERKKVARSYYLHLTDTLLWSFKLPYLSPRAIQQHFAFAHTEVLQRLRAEGHSTIILTMGHIGNWEVFTAAPYRLKELGFTNANIYKQLSNPYFDRLMIELRQKHGSTCIEMQQTARVLFEQAQNNNEATAIVAFLADQCPFPEAARYATLFFNTPTTFLVGWETLARKMNIPVVYMNIRSDSRFHWTGELRLLSEYPAQEAPFSLVERYAQLLEENVRQQPYAWLWSHNRWRVRPQDAPRITLSPSLKESSKDEKH